MANIPKLRVELFSPFRLCWKWCYPIIWSSLAVITVTNALSLSFPSEPSKSLEGPHPKFCSRFLWYAMISCKGKLEHILYRITSKYEGSSYRSYCLYFKRTPASFFGISSLINWMVLKENSVKHSSMKCENFFGSFLPTRKTCLTDSISESDLKWW